MEDKRFKKLDEGFICKTGNGRNAAYVRIE